jgi:hypothetical protein
MGDAVGYDAGLATTRPGKHQQRSLDMADRFALGRIEGFKEGIHAVSLGLFRGKHKIANRELAPIKQVLSALGSIRVIRGYLLVMVRLAFTTRQC